MFLAQGVCSSPKLVPLLFESFGPFLDRQETWLGRKYCAAEEVRVVCVGDRDEPSQDLVGKNSGISASCLTYVEDQPAVLAILVIGRMAIHNRNDIVHEARRRLPLGLPRLRC